MATPVDANYIKARSGLLDALEALEPHRQAVVLVGAQAVYEYTLDNDADFAVSPHTFDADLAVVPGLLVSAPTIIVAMQGAGYTLTDQPGIYRGGDGSQVHLLVPEAVGGRRGRGAALGIHGNHAARQVRGLEGALVSHRLMSIGALAPGDDRSYDINIAGPAALLVAKVHKIADRTNDSSNERVKDKDAFDIYRLLRSVDAAKLAMEVHRLLKSEISHEVTVEAVSLFRELFGDNAATGTQLVVRHVMGLEDTAFIAASSVSLSQDVLNLVSE